MSTGGRIVSDQSVPVANPDKGFPNPLADHFEGERTPEEQAAFDAEQAKRKAVAEAAGQTPSEAPYGDVPPNPTGAPGAAW